MQTRAIRATLAAACAALVLTSGTPAAEEQPSAPDAASPFGSKYSAGGIFHAQDAQGAQERNFLSRIRRLTVEGKRAGEGYWAPDGKRLVFQSEREPGNPFYQIYVLDLASGDTKRISPGMGKTTCAFFRPGGSEIMYASTHLDPNSKK